MESTLKFGTCNQIIMLLLLLRLVRFICFGMCPSVLAHTHPLMNQMSFIIGN